MTFTEAYVGKTIAGGIENIPNKQESMQGLNPPLALIYQGG